MKIKAEVSGIADAEEANAKRENVLILARGEFTIVYEHYALYALLILCIFV